MNKRCFVLWDQHDRFKKYHVFGFYKTLIKLKMFNSNYYNIFVDRKKNTVYLL